MIKKYPYLKDVDFLNKIYGQHNRSVYINVTSLDWAERPLQDVKGKVISASISMNGDSSVRRTANLSIKILNADELYSNIDSLFSINKKVFIETGLSNNFCHLGSRFYSNYPIVWFPIGVMIIQNCSVTHDISGTTISLSLGDKMCLLNGDAGGTIPASANFESIDTLGTDGDLHTEWARINEIIPELVNHFGGEDLNHIIVNDIPDRIQQVMKWRGSNPLYLWTNVNDVHQAFYTTIDATPAGEGWSRTKIIYNYDAGYTLTDFTFPGELVAGAGDSVCTVLDKIKSTLGNYEYYYDVFGNFIFQEIKNYVNTTEWRSLYNEMNDPNAYLPYSYNPRLNADTYTFNNTDFIINCNNSPQFNMIKNDFIVWGTRETSTGLKVPVRYHLAIDKRPDISEALTINIPICFDVDMYDKIKKCHYVENKRYTSFDELKAEFPQGIVGKYYDVFENGSGNAPSIYTWVTDIDYYNSLLANYESGADNDTSSIKTSDLNNNVEAGYVKLPYATYYATFTVPAHTDWRDRLYFQGIIDSKNGLATNDYFQELVNEWPKIYDSENHQYYDGVLDSPTTLDYWLDIVDDDAILNEFSVDAIGRRSYAKTDNDCNCVFEPDVPDIVMVNTNDDAAIIDARSGITLGQVKEYGLIPVQVPDAIYMSVATGGTFNSCYQHVRQILNDYTDYNNSVTITCLPIYHLEPNTRIYINDPDSGVQGEYLINTISFGLGNSNTMTISAKKINRKI